MQFQEAVANELISPQNFGRGSGSQTLPPVSTMSSPALPPHWNDSQDVYALQYVHERMRQLSLVKVIPLGGQLLINALVCNAWALFGIFVK